MTGKGLWTTLADRVDPTRLRPRDLTAAREPLRDRAPVRAMRVEDLRVFTEVPLQLRLNYSTHMG